jgi:regulator of ribonuclease activity A
MTFATTDLCDANEDKLADGRLAVLPPVFKSFGKRVQFAGPAATLRLFEDNTLVRATLETPGNGRVLVVDGGGSLRCALVGGNLGVLAEKNGWAGIVVNGCIRDSEEIDACDVGVRALALHPQKSRKTGSGESNVRVSIAGVAVAPGYWVYADADGVLIAQAEL